MKRVYKIGLILLVVILSVGSALVFYERGERGAEQPEEALSPPAVYLTPSSQQVSPGEEFVENVRVKPGDRGISAGEINLGFDPSAIQIVSVESENLLGNDPIVGTEEVNNKAGTLTYALARKGSTEPPTPTGSFAKITVKVLEGAESGEYGLKLENVGLSDENFEEVPGIEVKGSYIDVD